MKIEQTYTFDDVSIVPNYSEVDHRHEVRTTTQFTRNYTIEYPLVAAPMDSVCGYNMMVALAFSNAVGCLHRFSSIAIQANELLSFANFVRSMPLEYYPEKIPIVAAIGATGDYQARAEALVAAGANVLLVDVAHGDHKHVKNALSYLNKLSYRSKFDVIAGNIATENAVYRLQEWGADALRVGIGGGSMCETRVRTGIGVPQLSAVMAVARVASVPVISDGGIRYPGDVAKALAAGADSVMIGSLFAGTTESPGEVFETGQWPNVKRMKVYRGSASASAKYSQQVKANYVEGTATLVPDKGPVGSVVKTIMDGVRSSMSYVGATNIAEFQQKAEFVRITNAGLMEAHPHGLK